MMGDSRKTLQALFFEDTFCHKFHWFQSLS